MEEEKGREIQGGKRKRGLIKRKGDLDDQSKRKGSWIKEDIERRRGKRSFGRGGFQGSRSSRLLGLVFCLMMMIVIFH